MRRKLRIKMRIIAALAIVLLFGQCACAKHVEGLEVHFLDVGQGDCTIILCGDQSMIIDGGSPKQSQFVYSYLTNTLDMDYIDYMVATHPDMDHIGGLSAALHACRVGRIYASVLDSDKRAFQSLLKYAGMQDIRLQLPQAGETLRLGTAIVEFIGPIREYADENSNSIVLKLTYADSVYLFMGDAGSNVEDDLLDAGIDVCADVLKVGHHGSNSASSLRFLQAVQPEYAVISVGNNHYGHPTEEVLERLQEIGAEIYRTDEAGTIVLCA